MKRTPLKRKTPLQAKRLMKRSSTRHKRSCVSRKKDNAFRSATYLRWVRSLPCCRCLCPADDAHHVIGLGWGLSGMAMTAPDSFAMPACRECHTEIHADPYMQQFQPDWLIQTLTYGIREFREGPIHDALIEARDFILSKETAA